MSSDDTPSPLRYKLFLGFGLPSRFVMVLGGANRANAAFVAPGRVTVWVTKVPLAR